MPSAVRFLRAHAFTLFELLVVMIVLAAILAVAAPSFLGHRARAHDSHAQTQLAVGIRTTHLAWREELKLPVNEDALAAHIVAAQPQLGATHGYDDGASPSLGPDDVSVSRDDPDQVTECTYSRSQRYFCQRVHEKGLLANASGFISRCTGRTEPDTRACLADPTRAELDLAGPDCTGTSGYVNDVPELGCPVPAEPVYVLSTPGTWTNPLAKAVGIVARHQSPSGSRWYTSQGAITVPTFDPDAGPSYEADTKIENVGDMNGDGVEDIAFREAYLTGAAENARIHVQFGSTSMTTVALDSDGLLITRPTGTNDAMGYSMSGAGDVNGDGRDDLLLSSAASGTDTTVAYVIYGRAAAGTINVESMSAADGFALTVGTGGGLRPGVAGMGDVNADGRDDLAVVSSSFLTQASPARYGRVWVMHTPASPGASVSLESGSGYVVNLNTTTVSTTAYWSLDNASDQNADGSNDLLVSAPGGTPVKLIYSPASGVVDYTALGTGGWTVSGNFYHQVAIPVGDTDGDGRRDIALTGFAPSGLGTSALYVVQNMAAGANVNLRTAWSPTYGSLITNIDDTDDWRNLRVPVDMGDQNGDGRDDISYDYLYLMAGRGQNLTATPPGNTAADLAGYGWVQSNAYSTVSVADRNGDGRRDLGAWRSGFSFGGTQALVFVNSSPAPSIVAETSAPTVTTPDPAGQTQYVRFRFTLNDNFASGDELGTYVTAGVEWGPNVLYGAHAKASPDAALSASGTPAPVITAVGQHSFDNGTGTRLGPQGQWCLPAADPPDCYTDDVRVPSGTVMHYRYVAHTNKGVVTYGPDQTFIVP